MNYLSFKKMLRLLGEDKAQPTYVSVKPNDASIDDLQVFMHHIGLKTDQMVSPDELHATVVYSRKAVKISDADVRAWLPFSATGDELHFFKTRDGKDCLVLKLSSVQLRGMHAHFKTRHGASHDFPSFEAHVTLCYDTPPELKTKIEKIGEFKSVPIQFTKFENKALDLDWKPT